MYRKKMYQCICANSSSQKVSAPTLKGSFQIFFRVVNFYCRCQNLSQEQDALVPCDYVKFLISNNSRKRLVKKGVKIDSATFRINRIHLNSRHYKIFANNIITTKNIESSIFINRICCACVRSAHKSKRVEKFNQTKVHMFLSVRQHCWGKTRLKSLREFLTQLRYCQSSITISLC